MAPVTQHRAASRSWLGAILGALLLLPSQLSLSVAQEAPEKRANTTAARRGATRDSIKERDLQELAASTASMDKQMAAKTKSVDAPQPSMQSSLLTSSLVLSDGEKFTLVPVGSILRLPPAQRPHVLAAPQGVFTFWPAFLKRNAAWLAAREVPLAMAKGDAKLAEPVLRETATDSRIVVAVFKGGPITILEPAPEAAESSSGSRGSDNAQGQRTPSVKP